jgi:ferritin-like metal-binding protein YciE
MKLGSIEDVYVGQLVALRSAEAQLRDTLQAAQEAAGDQKLVKAISEHAGRLERQVERLEEVSAAAPGEVRDETCKPVEAMLEDVAAILGSDGPVEVRDAALVAALQRVVHFEIAAYGTARALADQLDQREAVDRLGETLAEEVEYDELLTKLATGGLIVSGLNERAQG